jgi:hypothetical protein
MRMTSERSGQLERRAALAPSSRHKDHDRTRYSRNVLAMSGGPSSCVFKGLPYLPIRAIYGPVEPFTGLGGRVRLVMSSTWGRADQQTSHDSLSLGRFVLRRILTTKDTKSHEGNLRTKAFVILRGLWCTSSRRNDNSPASPTRYPFVLSMV